jgi:hypothetical protein
MRSHTVGVRGRHDGSELQYVLGLLGENSAEESLAVRQLGFTTLVVRSIHLGLAYGTERDHRHEDRGAVPAANRRPLRSSDGQIMELLRRAERSLPSVRAPASKTTHGLHGRYASCLCSGDYGTGVHQPTEATMAAPCGTLRTPLSRGKLPRYPVVWFVSRVLKDSEHKPRLQTCIHPHHAT